MKHLAGPLTFAAFALVCTSSEAQAPPANEESPPLAAPEADGAVAPAPTTSAAAATPATPATTAAPATPAATATSVAPPQAARPSPPHALANTSAGFLIAELVGSLVVFAVYSSLAGEPSDRCTWCGTNDFDTSVRDALMMSDSGSPATISHVLSIGLAPAIALGGTLGPAIVGGKPWYGVQDAAIILSSFLLTTGIADGTKKLASRERPAFHYGREASTEARSTPLERNLSFFSGDTAWAFSLVSSGATLAYLRGYETAPYVAIGGAAVALGTGILRISADMHWGTDVLAGAAVGSAIGFVLPFVLHRRRATPSPVAVIPRLESTQAGLVAVGRF